MTDSEILQLREEIFADGRVTKEEFLNLWNLKDNFESTPIEFDSLFADAGVAYLMEDGVLDDKEAQFLVDKINEDEEIDDAEEELLYAISDYGTENISEILIDAFPEYFTEED